MAIGYQLTRRLTYDWLDLPTIDKYRIQWIFTKPLIRLRKKYLPLHTVLSYLHLEKSNVLP
jgi:hypothetical protein